MLKVYARPEPQRFDAEVRRPGRRALAEGRTPLPPYWRRCLPDLRSAYDGICAYSCFYIPKVVGSHTVEHFAPKSGAPHLAYEWSNYRLVCGLMNSRKRDFEDVLDPFEIDDGWFELEFASMEVQWADHLPAARRLLVDETIDRLKLNNEDCCTTRREWYEEWEDGHVDDDFMERRAPFIHREAIRQGKVP
jgi:hypothetical protein